MRSKHLDKFGAASKDVQRSRQNLFVNFMRAIAALIATIFFCEAYWLRGAGWRDGPPDIGFFVELFHIPLAIGLVAGAALLFQSDAIWKILGFICVAVCGCGLLDILFNSVVIGDRMQFYCRK